MSPGVCLIELQRRRKMDCRLDSNKEDRVGLLSYSPSEAAENPSELSSACSQAELTDGSSPSNKQAHSNEAQLSDVAAAERLLKEPCIEAGFYGAPSLSEGHYPPLEHPLSSNAASELEDVVTLEQPPCSEEDPDRMAQEPELSDDVKREIITDICKGVSILSCGSEAPGGSCHVYLIGTAHVSEESCREVQAAVHLLKPQVVFLELCQKRTSVLQRTPFVVPTVSDMILSWKQRKTNMLGIVYSWFLAKVAAKLDVRPGAEFRAAYEEALACGAKVVLGDRDVEADQLNELIEKLKDADILTIAFEELGKFSPTLMETLITERDLFMTAALQKIAEQHSLIVAVVGRGHVAGITKYWGQNIPIHNLLEIPQKRSLLGLRLRTYILIILVAFASFLAYVLR